MEKIFVIVCWLLSWNITSIAICSSSPCEYLKKYIYKSPLLHCLPLLLKTRLVDVNLVSFYLIFLLLSFKIPTIIYFTSLLVFTLSWSMLFSPLLHIMPWLFLEDYLHESLYKCCRFPSQFVCTQKLFATLVWIGDTCHHDKNCNSPPSSVVQLWTGVWQEWRGKTCITSFLTTNLITRFG